MTDSEMDDQDSNADDDNVSSQNDQQYSTIPRWSSHSKEEEEEEEEKEEEEEEEEVNADDYDNELQTSFATSIDDPISDVAYGVDVESSDDELLVNRKTTKNSPKKKLAKKKISAISKRSVSKNQTKSKLKKRTAQEVFPSEVDDDEEVMASVVMDETLGSEYDSVDAEVVAEVVPKGKQGEAGRKKRKKSTLVKVRRKPGPRPGWKKRRLERGSDMSSDESIQGRREIPAQKRDAAERSRDILLHSVEHLPFAASDSFIVRNFGHIKEERDIDPYDVLYSSPNSLYPVGYSCDRYEFSPIHGRVIKFRCEILDGSKYAGLLHRDSDNNISDDVYDGPIFRIIWGKGVDEWDFDRSIPFDMYTMAAPIQNGIESSQHSTRLQPEVGMRVKVRFDEDTWYKGTLGQVQPHDHTIDEKSKKKGQNTKQIFTVQILYEDGSNEQLDIPDPDVVLLPRDENELLDGQCSLRGKSVFSVVGKTATEAWGRTLIKLGFLDEVSFDLSLQAIVEAHTDGLLEADDRLATIFKQRKEARARHYQKLKGKTNGKVSTGASINVSPVLNHEDEAPVDEIKVEEEDQSEDVGLREAPTGMEESLRMALHNLYEEYESVLAQSRGLATELGNVRVSNLGSFLLYPFSEEETMKSVMSSVIKKEKSRMGSTGSRRKVIIATDLLEKCTSFFNYGIERLIEGLPGSESASSYVYHDLRSPNASGVNQNWVYEILSKLKRQKVASENDDNLQGGAGISDQHNKNKKHDERESRKKQKREELEREKQVRRNERLSRLSNQIDERLMKEASTAREKIIGICVKAATKEFNRRRKAAEVMTTHKVEFSNMELSCPRIKVTDLPPLSKDYDVDVVRIWNFITTFKGAFKSAYEQFHDLTIDILQDSLDCMRDHSTFDSERSKAIAVLSNLAIALCKPISIGLLKTLSSTLTSFTPEKFGADGTNFFDKVESDPFSVNVHTWKEVARLALLSDGLNEVGYTKQDQAHILRGFRSGGHPNSKQAKKLRRGEDYALVLQQQLLHRTVALAGNQSDSVKVKISVPSKPSCVPNDWTFYLHNIASLPTNSVSGVKANIRKAISVLRAVPSENRGGLSSDDITKKLQNAVVLLDPIGESVTSSSQIQEICKNVRDQILNILNSCQTEWSKQQTTGISSDPLSVRVTTAHPTARSRIGFVQTLSLSREMHKRYTHLKEDYMGSAVKLKAELERKLGDEDDTDDEDEEANGAQSSESQLEESIISTDTKKIGKTTDYDDFCGDDPCAPELLRRCLAVLRTLCVSSPAEPFIFPVDPQANPKYYDTILRPMSLYDVGKVLQSSIKTSSKIDDVEKSVAEFGRNVRLIYLNCMCYSNIGGSIISAAEEMIRIFERLFFDWVLAPDNDLPSLDMLDDDHCVEHHDSDDDCNVLICDGCEGKFNMSRLNPPLRSVPSGDWYCPHCLNGRCWLTVDPRINLPISNNCHNGIISRCIVSRGDRETDKATLSYVISYKNNYDELWTLDEVDKALSDAGYSVPRIRCLEAVAESPGYGMGSDHGFILDILPAPLNPFVSDIAAQKTLSSSIFKDTIVMCATLLLLDVQELSASEWIRLLILLVIKCTSSEIFQEEISNLEIEGASKFNAESSSLKISSIYDVLPPAADDESDNRSINSFDNQDEKSDQEINTYKLGIFDPSRSKVDHVIDHINYHGIEEVRADVIETEHATEASIVPSIIYEDKNNEEKDPKRANMPNGWSARNDRQRAREDGFLAQSIKIQLTSAIASFEEDSVTQVIDNMLANKCDGLRFSDCRCPSSVCDFCNLSDVALGTPLFRVPNDQEWLDMMSHTGASRKIFLTAEIGLCSDSSITRRSKLMLVKIRLGNKLVSGKLENNDGVDNSVTEFLPRNCAGFQHELRCRLQDGIPFISGSLSAHDCCAAAAHRARCDKLLLEGKERATEDLERDFGSICGRSLPLGCDELGRSYWKFSVDPESLFVLIPALDSNSERVRRYATPESIASIIVYLGGACPSAAIVKAFSEARRVLKGRQWVALLQSRSLVTNTGCLSSKSDKGNAIVTVPDETNAETLYETPFTVGENVLVEDASGRLLWNASVVNTIQTKDGKIDAYRVHYKNWSTRFDDWVSPMRVVEPTKHNLLVQNEYWQEMLNERTFVPESMNLIATSFIREPRRARGNIPPPIYSELFNNSTMSIEKRTFEHLKFGVLLVEAALPRGSLNTSSDEGLCSPEMTAGWRFMVTKAQGPRALAGCLIILENSIRKQWFRPDTEQLLMCMHRPFKAVNEATNSSIALRLWLLDRGIKYTQIEG